MAGKELSFQIARETILPSSYQAFLGPRNGNKSG